MLALEELTALRSRGACLGDIPMTLNRRNAMGLMAAATGSAALFPSSFLGSSPSQAAELNDSGLHVQPWFADESLEMPKDTFEEALDAGKNLAIFWEQRGCPYCKEMHEVNLADKEIVDYIKSNFVVLQLNFKGGREVMDFDGKTMTERQLANRWLVNFTPTINLFPMDKAKVLGRPGAKAEVFRIPGYFKPFHFITAFEYVRGKHYERLGPTGYQTYINERAARLRKQGKKVKVW